MIEPVWPMAAPKPLKVLVSDNGVCYVAKDDVEFLKQVRRALNTNTLINIETGEHITSVTID